MLHGGSFFKKRPPWPPEAKRKSVPTGFLGLCGLFLQHQVLFKIAEPLSRSRDLARDYLLQFKFSIAL
jgi:hypothetical protein